MGQFTSLLDRWLKVGLVLHTTIMGGLLGTLLYITVQP